MEPQKLDIKKKIECIDRELQILHASDANIVSQLNALASREKINTEQIQDTANLKQSQREFGKAYNTSITSINDKMQNYDQRLTDLAKTTEKTLTEYKTLFESLITNQKVVHEKEISELKIKLDKDMALFKTEIHDQRGYINNQIDLKMVNINSHLNSHTSTFDNQMQTLNKQMLELKSELKVISNSLIF